MTTPFWPLAAAAVFASAGAAQLTDPDRRLPVEPDWRTVPQLTPEQKRQREHDARTRLGEHGLAVSLLGVAFIPPDHESLGEIGGLSGLAFLKDNRFLVVSDNSKQPAMYELRIALRPTDNPERFAITPELAAAPMTIEHAALDAESVAVLPRDAGIVVGYERPPTVAAYRSRSDGPWVTERLAIPAALTDEIRHNRAFESIAVRTLDSGVEIWAATEAAPKTDGEEAGAAAGTRCRVVAFTGRDFTLDREMVYLTEPGPEGPLKVAFNSLAEFCALPDGRFLALERGVSPLAGYHANIYILDGSTRAPADGNAHPELIKGLLANVRDLGVHTLTNLEGMALGPRIADLTGDDEQKGRLLLMVADNNFGSDGIRESQVVALRIVGLDPQDLEGDKGD